MASYRLKNYISSRLCILINGIIRKEYKLCFHSKLPSPTKKTHFRSQHVGAASAWIRDASPHENGLLPERPVPSDLLRWSRWPAKHIFRRSGGAAAMSTFSALCHFCEVHGPCVVMVSQSLREGRGAGRAAAARLATRDIAATTPLPPVPEVFAAPHLVQDIRNSPRFPIFPFFYGRNSLEGLRCLLQIRYKRIGRYWYQYTVYFCCSNRTVGTYVCDARALSMRHL